MERDAAIAELYRVDSKAEIVNGEIVLMPAAGGTHGLVALRIAMSLYEHGKRTGHGHALPDGVGFIVDLPHRWSFCPDGAFCHQPITPAFVEGAPVFAFEVRSPEDFGPAAERAMADKRADYFAAGTLVVWDVDPLRDFVVRVYRASEPSTPSVYHRGDIAEAEPAVPGWSISVDDLFLD